MPSNTNMLQLMHDAVGPVNSIKASIELLRSGKMSPEDTAKLFDAMETRANDLNKVLDNFYINNKEELNRTQKFMMETFDKDLSDEDFKRVKHAIKVYFSSKLEKDI